LSISKPLEDKQIGLLTEKLAGPPRRAMVRMRSDVQSSKNTG
jgi:hypothetical protein